MTTAAVPFVKITISDHSSASTVQNYSSLTASLVTSAAKINHPSAPHPILATYFVDEPKRQSTPVSSYNGDSTGDGTVGLTDVEQIIRRISLSHKAGAWDMQTSGGAANSWMNTLDANAKGWLDICDAVTTLIALKNFSGNTGGSGKQEFESYDGTSTYRRA